MAAAWTNIVDGDVDPESPITTSLMQALRDNPEGIAKAASGAPTIVNGALASYPWSQGDIAANAIGQSELKTATADTSVSGLASGEQNNVSLTGGSWSHWAIADGSIEDLQISASTSTSNFTLAVKNNSGGGNESAILHERYHTSSPPYDLGDGICGLFVFAAILPDGSIGSYSVAPDPVWANNGPTNIRPEWTDKKTGKKYRRVRRPAVTLADVDAGRADIADYIAAQAEATVEEVEITHAYKNADMELIPHSWASPPQGTICLLDPINTHDLLMLHEAGEDVAELIHKGYIQIGDECKRCGPPGVMPVSWKWRNTRP